jgi:hypothetical protein
MPASVLVTVAGLLGLLLGMVIAFGREYSVRARQDPGNGGFFAAWDQFKADLRRAVPPYRSRRTQAPSVAK